ncbi:MAG: serpin family protein [Lachnospiraceae bacterium]
MRKRNKKYPKRYFISMICLIGGLISVIFIMESVFALRVKDLTSRLTLNSINSQMDISDQEKVNKIMDFSVKLFQNSVSSSDNTLISPLSSLVAMAMVADGAQGNTKVQIEDALGFTVEELNEYVYLYRQDLPDSESCSLKLNNSVWLNEDKKLSLEQPFLQAIADYTGAHVYQIPFHNEESLELINHYISRETNGMIEEVLAEIPDQAVMYLFSTLEFGSKWATPYKDHDVSEGIFTTESGVVRNVKMMDSKEFLYINGEKTTGVVKYYTDYRYAFVALLPEEGIFIRDYLSSLTGDRLLQMINQAGQKIVMVELPKFRIQSSVELDDSLADIGITDAFDSLQADLSGIASLEENNIYIESIVQKTYIDVNEDGTTAGVATSVELYESTEIIEDPVYVTFDRPFVYLILDCQTNMPVLMGTVMDVIE